MPYNGVCVDYRTQPVQSNFLLMLVQVRYYNNHYDLDDATL